MKTKNMTTLHFKESMGRSPLQLRFLLIPLLLACFAAVFISIPTPAAAGGMVPFKGVVSGNIPADFATNPDYFVEGNPCLRDFFVSNSGIATQLGAFAGIAEFIPNLCDGSYTGFFYWTAANGDEISGYFVGQLTPTATPGLFDNNETAVVTAGTGRFANATSTFTLTGQVNFNTLSVVLPWRGTISTVGSTKH
jgi:hypothetical protein